MPHNCMILGAGRSGTSLTAGLLSEAGYFFGGKLLPATEGNPKGFYEAVEVNALNEEMLRDCIPARPRFWGRYFFYNRPRRAGNDRWLFAPPEGVEPEFKEEYRTRIEAILSKQPYCLKDPRFSYSFPIWQPFLRDTRFLCVFRHPAEVVNSTQKFLQAYKGIAPSDRQLYDNFCAMYRRILDSYSKKGEWLFLSFESLFSPEAHEKLGSFLDAPVKADFASTSLKRSSSERAVPDSAMKVYEELLERVTLR